ncbi:uncharacterized protein [Embiotoca jacksoni]|uniref:uncharacterized protein n=1 Tax=Embiotoca jacksoni TaxID=100190 RepID=UPI0037042AFF
MAARAAAVLPLMLLLSGSMLLGPSTGSGPPPDPERGRTELRRVRSLATQPRYGECWSRALELLDTRCKDMTSEGQSLIALRFAHCHLSSSGRDFPSCPEGSEVSRCTSAMDVVAFNTYTEFFTHTHSICHFLQSEAWQSRAESSMHRLTESSAGVAEQLQSTRKMAEELIEAQSAALEAQQEILTNGEELRVTLRDSTQGKKNQHYHNLRDSTQGKKNQHYHNLRDSTQGLRSVFSELSSVSREQQVALSELFNRVSFLQSFLLMEAHSLSSCCYNAAALCTSFLITSTQRSSRARTPTHGQYAHPRLTRDSPETHPRLTRDSPETHLSYVTRSLCVFRVQERLSVLVCVLRRVTVCVGVCVLLLVCVRYRDPVQQSLQVLQQLRETQRSLQEALQHAESLAERRKTTEDVRLPVKRSVSRRREEALRRKEDRREEEEEEEEESPPTNSSHLSHLSDTGSRNISHNASVQSPDRRPRLPSHTTSTSSPLVYSILVEDKQPRYSLRSRRSETHRLHR